jgi:hypothetical protein
MAVIGATVEPAIGAAGYDDANDNGEYDVGEATYTESELYSFDQDVNLVVVGDESGTLSRSGGSISIKAQSITSEADIEANSITLAAERGGAGTVDIAGQRIETTSGGLSVTGAEIVATDAVVSTSGGGISLKAEKDGAGPVTIDGIDISTTDNSVTITGASVSGVDATVEVTRGSISIDATKGSGGSIDMSGSRLTSTGDNSISLKSNGDIFLDDTAQQEAKVDAENGGATATVGDKDNTLHVSGLEIIDNNDKLKLKPGGANVDGTPQSGSVN